MKTKRDKCLNLLKKYWYIVLIVLVVIVLAIIYVCGFSKDDVLVLKKEQITYEYGEKVSLTAKKYLDVSHLDNDVLKNIKVTSNLKNEVVTTTDESGNEKEEKKDYPKVGDYKITLAYEDEKVEVKITVQDTTAPELDVPESIEIVQGTDLNTYDFQSLMVATDLAELKDYKFDTSNVDVNTIGEYVAKVSISDVNKNKTEKEFKIIIVTAPAVAEDEVAVTEIVLDEETGQKKTVVTTKPKSAVISSSTGSSNTSSSNSSGTSSNTSSGSSNSSSSNNTSSSNSSNTSSSNNTSSNSNNNSSSNNTGGSNSSNTSKYLKVIYWAKCSCGGEVTKVLTFKDYAEYYADSNDYVEDILNELYDQGHDGRGHGSVRYGCDTEWVYN